MAEDNEAAETGPGNHQLLAEGSRCQAGYFGSTECSRKEVGKYRFERIFILIEVQLRVRMYHR